jgi:UDP-N-acetylmuramoyl-L-alanyl-D-glutamate--2,6-diaminopimelate ligase
VTTLGSLLEAVRFGRLLGDPDLELTGISHDTTQVKPGDLFVCIPGHSADSRAFVPRALAAGAAAVMLEPPPCDIEAAQLLVPSVREALPQAAAALYGAPHGVPVVGITGTNGKTTTAYLIAAILEAAGRTCAMLGSVVTSVGERVISSEHTTPEATTLHEFWRAAQSEGANALVMEVSSHGLLLHRADGLTFNVGVFTNLTRDHLDYHPDLAAYRGAKSRLFGRLDRRGSAVLNRDDPAWGEFAKATPARVLTYGLDPQADVHPLDLAVRSSGIGFDLVSPAGTFRVESPLFGRFNVANLLAAAAAALALRVQPADVARGLASVAGVPGRAERIDCGQPFVVINDFAHTPDALARILAAARELTPGALHVVFGCGGDRDPGKRPQMGNVARSSADRVTVTSDNPRTEEPDAIIAQIVAGMPDTTNVEVEPDRTSAIRAALAVQRRGDTLVVAGKGHERYQIIGTTRHRYDDADVLRKELSRLGYA